MREIEFWKTKGIIYDNEPYTFKDSIFSDHIYHNYNIYCKILINNLKNI